MFFFLLELFLKFFQPQYLLPLKHDSDLLWEYIPNSATGSFLIINSKGLRDYEHTYEKPEGTFRILVLGDSFIEAAQVPLNETLSKHLESLLNTNLDKDIYYEVINAGFSMYGTEQELIFLETEGVRYKPDIVILSFFPANDVFDNTKGIFLLRTMFFKGISIRI